MVGMIPEKSIVLRNLRDFLMVVRRLHYRQLDLPTLHEELSLKLLRSKNRRMTRKKRK
jgi:hypothetical protein